MMDHLVYQGYGIRGPPHDEAHYHSSFYRMTLSLKEKQHIVNAIDNRKQKQESILSQTRSIT